MGSSLSPDLAKAFMWSFEYKCLEDCPRYLKPVVYTRYADELPVFFSSPDQTERTKDYLT